MATYRIAGTDFFMDEADMPSCCASFADGRDAFICPNCGCGWEPPTDEMWEMQQRLEELGEAAQEERRERGEW